MTMEILIAAAAYREIMFLKRYQSCVLEITVLNGTHKLELNVYKMYNNINFSWLPVVKRANGHCYPCFNSL